MIRRIRIAATALLLGAGTLATSRRADAQIAANETWLTLRTPHFRIHFTPALTPFGRRAANDAEWAYANLSTVLTRPRGVIDIVITDAVDGSNGAATVFPRNHIVIQARPPVDASSLESYDDWLRLVLQHELTHIFHLDRARGIWRLGQDIFGRNPLLFPNEYSPSWLTEGLAVYYESKFTSGGRLDGTFQDALARAAAREHALPPVDALSLISSRYPGGTGTYAYGSFLVDKLAHERGDAGVRKFVESSSAQLIPFRLDHVAKGAFGESFTDAWRTWRDSVNRATTSGVMPSSSWRPLPDGGRTVAYPRWRGDSVLYVADNGKESMGLYSMSMSGAVHRLDRRNSLDANATGPDNRVVFAQLEYLDRFHLYSDLYVTRYGMTRRLTYGARLSAPDVRWDGAIVAVQTVPGSTRLVRVAADGRSITPITRAPVDTQWAWPRWSPRGDRIATIRVTGGRNAVVVLDSTGKLLRTAYDAHAVARSLSWSPDGTSVYFLSDQSGASRMYVANVTTGVVQLVERGDATVDLAGLDVRATVAGPTTTSTSTASRHGATGEPAAIVTYMKADGLHLATSLLAPIGPRMDSTGGEQWTETMPPILTHYDTATIRPYSPWRSLMPSYWSPVLDGSGTNGVLIGALTSGEDLVGRHSYSAQAFVNVRNRNVDMLGSYEYSRFASTVFDLSAEQSWSYATLLLNFQPVGNLDKRTRLYSLHATFERPRARTYSALIVGTELETDDYQAVPDSLTSKLPTFYSHSHSYPTLLAAAQFSNVQRPDLSISPEDGVAISSTARERWESGNDGSASLSLVGVGTMYKSLDLPGFAHHVLALRVAGGYADNHSGSRFSLGGISGSPLQILPGFTVGDQARTFFVRGFPSGIEQGTDAMTVSAEYRAPLAIIARGTGLYPFFLDRASLSFFSDAGRAYCTGNGAPACTTDNFGTPTLASVGGELNLDGALQYDFAYRFRFGLAKPVRGTEVLTNAGIQGYVTIGLAF